MIRETAIRCVGLCGLLDKDFALQYLLLAVASGLGLYAIHRGLEIEPPSFVTDAISAFSARLSRVGRSASPAT